MFAKRVMCCQPQWWNWGRAPFRTDHSKFSFPLTLSAIVVVFIRLTSSQEYEYGSVGLTKSPSVSNNVYRYHIREVFMKQSQNDTEESLPAINELLQNLLKERIQQEKKQRNSEDVPQTHYFNSESKVATFKPVHSSHFLDMSTNYGDKVPTNNGDVQDFDMDGGSLPPHLTEIFEQLDHDSSFGIVQKKELKHYLPIISIAIVYLFISILVLGAAIMPEDQCSTKDMDMSLVSWDLNPRRRFVPGRPVDPFLQVKLLNLFHGYDKDDHNDDDSDELSDIGMDEGYLATELSFINSLCPTQAFFFSLSPRHVEAFSALKRLFLAQYTPEEMISLAKYLLWKKKVHPKVWYIALTQARLARADMAGFSLAHPLDAIPDWYIPGDMLLNKWEKSRWRRRNMRSLHGSSVTHSRSRNSTFIGNKRESDKGKSGGIKKLKRKRPHLPRRNLKDDHPRKSNRGGQKGCIIVDGNVGIDNGIENELWYWREDIMLNQHHWYWHQAHPPNGTHEDRRAELFYYMHRIFIARYNAERLSNGMARVLPLRMRRGALIPEGYNSHLADINSGIYWTPRAPDTPLQDALHANDRDLGEDITLRNYTRFRRRLVTSMISGRLLSESGELVSINHAGGIEELTNTVEASDISVNPMFYSSQGIHTLGHTLIGFAADPDFRLGRVTGIMSDGALSMRDSSFYSYHLFLDNFFELHKQQLAPYRPTGGDFPLLWSGVDVVNVKLNSQGGGPLNELRTFWTHHSFELSPGVDGSIKTGGRPKVCAQHLDHEPFHFKIVVDRKPCAHSGSGKATIRIFMAPRYDEEGVRIPVQIQRRLMFPLDSFPVKLKVGRNTITRYAEDSSLTQPWTKSLRELERGPNPSGSAEFCGCGWPQHLYIPKGNSDGMPFDLFVMATNYDEDHVANNPRHLGIPETCNSPFIFCGLPRRTYPDKRPMGYPFDRPLFKSHNCPPGWTLSSGICKVISAVLFRPIDTLEQYVSLVPNMAMVKFHIKHLNRFLPEPVNH